MKRNAPGVGGTAKRATGRNDREMRAAVGQAAAAGNEEVGVTEAREKSEGREKTKKTKVRAKEVEKREEEKTRGWQGRHQKKKNQGKEQFSARTMSIVEAKQRLRKGEKGEEKGGGRAGKRRKRGLAKRPYRCTPISLFLAGAAKEGSSPRLPHWRAISSFSGSP